MPTVTASTFADPRDVARFWDCKRKGGTDKVCYRVGDNGVGKWGHATATLHTPFVALPYEEWAGSAHTGGDKVVVTYKGRRVVAELGDTMPHRQWIKNGAGIDLNPACAAALGIATGTLTDGVQWEWLDTRAEQHLV